MTMQTTYMGYAVTVTGDTMRPYVLTGPRGGVRQLRRWPDGGPRMYVTDQYGQMASVKGNYQFTDEGGALAARSAR